MTLERLDLLRLKAADGLATPAERDEVRAQGVDLDADLALRRVVARALVAPPLTLPGEPPFAEGVLAALDLGDDGLARHLRDALHGGPPPELADAVLAALEIQDAYRRDAVVAALGAGAGAAPELGDPVVGAAGLADPSAAVGRALRGALDAGAPPDLVAAVMDGIDLRDGGLGDSLRSALAAGPAPDLADDVMGALGLAVEDADLLGDALARAAGPTPDLGADVMAALGLGSAAAPAATTTGAVYELSPRARRWVPLAGLAAAAAAAVLAVVGLPDPGRSDHHGELATHIHLEAVNEIEIEDISSDPEAMVQVLQFEENAPTIIFIDVLEEPEGAASDEGVPL